MRQRSELPMSKITFICEHHDGSKITLERSGDSVLPEVLESFEFFLKGAGFHFDGYLDFVQDDIFSTASDYDEPTDYGAGQPSHSINLDTTITTDSDTTVSFK